MTQFNDLSVLRTKIYDLNLCTFFGTPGITTGWPFQVSSEIKDYRDCNK